MAFEHTAIERINGSEHIVRIQLDKLINSDGDNHPVEEAFESCIKKGDIRLIVDLANIQYPSSSLIAIFVEMTSRVRRLNGDLKLINIQHSTRNNLATFSPISYLSLEGDEAYAINEFKKYESDTSESVNRIIDSVDIVDDPYIEKIQGSLGKPESESVVASSQSESSDINREHEDVGKQEVEKNHFRVKSIAKNLYSICDFVTKHANHAGFNAREIGKTKIAVYEACLNIIEHAYHSDPDNWIDVWVYHDDKKFTIEILDRGFGFEGFDEKNYDVFSAMNGRQTGGFGLYIIRRSMDEIRYKADKANGNLLTMVKYLTTS